MTAYRQELKFLIDHNTKSLLLERWRPYLVRAPFTNEDGVSPILSLYYDSPQLAFYFDKLDGIRSRQKVRIRTYGHCFRAGQTTILEIKFRKNDLVKKFRSRLTNFEESQLDPANWHYEDREAEAAFDAMKEIYRLRPTVQVFYQRQAFEGAVERDLRVTFDTSLVGMHPGERISHAVLADRSRSLMPDTLSILEVKATQEIPPWIYSGAIAGELQQQTIPKYITAIEFLGLANQRTAGVYA
jgi:hypothetical protein